MPARLASRDFARHCGTPQRPVDLNSGVFVCHKTRSEEDDEEPGRPIICAGWLAAVGRHSLLVRVAVRLGLIPRAALHPDPAGPPLFSSFTEMVAGHTFIDREGVTHAPPAAPDHR
jgi:hypothetical protein